MRLHFRHQQHVQHTNSIRGRPDTTWRKPTGTQEAQTEADGAVHDGRHERRITGVRYANHRDQTAGTLNQSRTLLEVQSGAIWHGGMYTTGSGGELSVHQADDTLLYPTAKDFYHSITWSLIF